MLAERGATVVALSRSAADLAALTAAIGCETLTVDLADPVATREAALSAQPIDLLVNNAGTTELASFLDTSVETFDHLMAVNARAAMIVAQECARSMIDRGVKGAIVNVSSLASEIGIPDHTAYSASKGAMDAMTRVWAKELGPHGIRVNTINPVVTLNRHGDQGVERRGQGRVDAVAHPAAEIRYARRGGRGDLLPRQRWRQHDPRRMPPRRRRVPGDLATGRRVGEAGSFAHAVAAVRGPRGHGAPRLCPPYAPCSTPYAASFSGCSVSWRSSASGRAGLSFCFCRAP